MVTLDSLGVRRGRVTAAIAAALATVLLRSCCCCRRRRRGTTAAGRVGGSGAVVHAALVVLVLVLVLGLGLRLAFARRLHEHVCHVSALVVLRQPLVVALVFGVPCDHVPGVQETRYLCFC